MRTLPKRLRIDPQRLDYLVAIVLTITLELETWLEMAPSHQRVVVAITGPVMTATVALRRRYPATAGITAGLLAVVVAAFWGPPSLISNGIAWMCALYGLAVWATPRRFAIGVVVITLGNVAADFGPAQPNALPFAVVTAVVLVLVHRVVAAREQRAQIAERERDLAAREAIVEERARIARELHDVIAHHVSMMVVQAGAERRVLDGEDNSTREVLLTIEQIGRDALTEMRRLLGILRTDADDPLGPQPGLDDVPRLVTQLGEAGLPVELHIDGERRALPLGIDLSAYRIVQEALTNALKHAGDARATVHIRYAPDALELEIADDGRGRPAGQDGGGHGLIGMRERATLYGGRVEARRDPAGGFVVRAKLPIA